MKISDMEIKTIREKALKKLDCLEIDLIGAAIDAITENKPLLNSEIAALKKLANLIGIPEEVFLESIFETVQETI